jgi:hypothetical protein
MNFISNLIFEDINTEKHYKTQKAAGKDHAWTLITVNSLADLYSNQVKFAEAEEMYKHALPEEKTLLEKTRHRPWKLSTISAPCTLNKGSWQKQKKCTSMHFQD